MSKSHSAWRNKKAQALRNLLVETFPNCFSPKRTPKRPLKIGIIHDIIAALPETGVIRLRFALADYTGGPTYLENVIAGAERIDLQGNPCGVVTEPEAAHAAERLKGIVAFRRRGANQQQVEEATP